MSGYIGINGKARNIVNGYIGIDGKARNIIKCYIGDENGKAKLLLSFDKWDGTTLKTINGSNVSNYNINSIYSPRLRFRDFGVFLIVKK